MQGIVDAVALDEFKKDLDISQYFPYNERGFI